MVVSVIFMHIGICESHLEYGSACKEQINSISACSERGTLTGTLLQSSIETLRKKDINDVSSLVGWFPNDSSSKQKEV